MSGQDGAKTPHEAFYFYRDERLQAVRSGPHGNCMSIAPSGMTPPGTTSRCSSISATTSANGATSPPGYPGVVERLLALAERAREDLGDAATGRKGANVRPVGTL